MKSFKEYSRLTRGFAIGGIDSVHPIASLGDRPPKGKGSRDSRAVGLVHAEKNPRIPRKPGQKAGSKKHSDLYTDENPKGTIHGLGFKDVETARASVKKIEGSGKSHAHKIQAAIAMEQRARVMGKKAEAAIYRAYIEKMKKKTKEMRNEGIKMPDYGKQLKRDASKLGMKVNFTASGTFILLGKDEDTLKDHQKVAKKIGMRAIEYNKTARGGSRTELRNEDAHGFKCPPGYKFDRKLMACVPKRTRFKTVYAYPYFFGGTKSGDQSGQAQNGQNGNGNGNGNAQGGNGNGNGGNGNGGNGSGGNGGGNGG